MIHKKEGTFQDLMGVKLVISNFPFCIIYKNVWWLYLAVDVADFEIAIYFVILKTKTFLYYQ
jgi:hypothetical protein